MPTMTLRRTVLVVPLVTAAIASCSPVTPSGSPSSPASPVNTTVVATPTPTPTSTPSPSPTWSADQTAAVKTAEEFKRASSEARQMRRNPNDLYNYGRGASVKASIKSVNDLAFLKLKEAGESKLVGFQPRSPSKRSGRSLVVVDACLDNRLMRIVDRSGKDVMSSDSKVISPVSWTVERWPDRWYVTDLAQGTHRCDP